MKGAEGFIAWVERSQCLHYDHFIEPHSFIPLSQFNLLVDLHSFPMGLIICKCWEQ